MSAILEDIYQRLFDAYGPQYWWPGDTPWEVACGAVLTQNTNWKNVVKAITNLSSADALSASAVKAFLLKDLAELIRPAGYFNIKARRLKNLSDWWLEIEAPDGTSGIPLETLRPDLLSVNGIGPETADSILLYAFDHPTFVVDAYTRRVFSRHALVGESATYGEIKEYFESELTANRQLFNEYHALIVRVAKEHCRTVAQCEGCPLECLLPKPLSAE